MIEKGHKVMQSNKLINAAYSLTLNQKRLVLCGLAALKNENFPDGLTVKITTHEFAKIFDQSMDTAKHNLREAVAKIMDTPSFWYQAGKGRKAGTRWVSEAEILDEEEGAVIVTFPPKLLPFLKELSGFVSYSLSDVASLKSAHAIRLFEFALQWPKIGKFKLEVKELKEKLCLENKYPAFKDFKKRVLDPSVLQINKYAGFKLNYVLIKCGRSYKYIEFKIQNPEEIDKIKGRAELKKLLDAVKI